MSKCCCLMEPLMKNSLVNFEKAWKNLLKSNQINILECYGWKNSKCKRPNQGKNY